MKVRYRRTRRDPGGDSADRKVRVKCHNCAGAGRIAHFSHVNNGVCFTCGGSGKLEAWEHDITVKRMPRAKVIAGLRRCFDTLEHEKKTGRQILDDWGHVPLAQYLANAEPDVHKRAWAWLEKFAASLPSRNTEKWMLSLIRGQEETFKSELLAGKTTRAGRRSQRDPERKRAARKARRRYR